ncbi:MAG: M23 family metallopeptidase, partial [Candidatus Hydrothermarchaeales archaeon]
ESELFPGFSKETQEFIINTPWNQDGVDSSDIAYIDSLPSDFNVLDKNKNTDGGGELGYVEDWIEVFLKKNVYDASDDEGFLTWPLYCEDPQTITAFFDIEPSICPGNCDSGRRDWEGGKHTYDTHIGTDIVISKKTPILASFAGKVIFAEFDTDGSGNSIRLKHDNGYYSRYNHLVEDGFLVEINQRVNRGEVIGLSGNTGQAVTPHLHFQIWSHYPNGWQNMNEDPFRDESNPNSKSKWINDNEPLCINKNGNLNFAPLIIGDWLADNKGDYAKD